MSNKDDFDYSLSDEEKTVIDNTQEIIKKSLILVAVLFSVLCFYYIAINASKFIAQQAKEQEITLDPLIDQVMNEQKSQEEIPLIQAKPGPYKIRIKEKGNQSMGSAIYDDILADNTKKKRKVKIIESAEKPILLKKPTKKPKKTVKKEKVKPAPIVEDESKEFFAQVASLKSQDIAKRYAADLKKYSTLLKNVKVFIEKTQIPQKGIFYRVQIGAFPDYKGAKDFCKKLGSEKKIKAQFGKIGCIVAF